MRKCTLQYVKWKCIWILCGSQKSLLSNNELPVLVSLIIIEKQKNGCCMCAKYNYSQRPRFVMWCLYSIQKYSARFEMNCMANYHSNSYSLSIMLCGRWLFSVIISWWCGCSRCDHCFTFNNQNGPLWHLWHFQYGLMEFLATLYWCQSLRTAKWSRRVKVSVEQSYFTVKVHELFQ